MTDRERHPMTPMSTASRTARDLRDKASEFSREKEKRSAAVFEQMQTERVIIDAKTAKLRALRLAKEHADREAAAAKSEDK